MISTKSERKPLTSTISLTDQITRKFENRSLQNFQTWRFMHTSLSRRKQQRNGLNGTVKFLNCFFLPEKKSRICCFLWSRQVYSQKGLLCRSSHEVLIKYGVSVARGKTSFSCSILFPVYLKRRIFANICF